MADYQTGFQDADPGHNCSYQLNEFIHRPDKPKNQYFTDPGCGTGCQVNYLAESGHNACGTANAEKKLLLLKKQLRPLFVRDPSAEKGLSNITCYLILSYIQ